MVTGRIAAEHRSLNRIREVTPIWTHLTHGFLDSQRSLDRFSRFAWLTVVTSTQTETTPLRL